MPLPRWYLQRLRCMPPAELPWRAYRVARGRVDALKSPPRAEQVVLESVARGPIRVAERSETWPQFPLPLAEPPEQWRDGTVREAEDLLAHRMTLFALEREPVGNKIDWNCDYLTGTSVPLVHASKLDYRNAGQVGDVKYVWELGRMQHLKRLAQAWRYTGDERYPREIVQQITEFIQQCPHMMGIQWSSPMEAALRLISWTWSFQLIRDWSGLTDDFCKLLLRSIHQHLRFIDRNYSLFSSANNHLVAEASGAYFAASYWSQLKNAARWRARARQHLVRECPRQHYPDGVNKEQTFKYQFFVWDLFVIAALMGRACGDPFPAAYWNRLQRSAMFLASVSDSRGNTPNVGDEDGGMAVDLGGDHDRPAISLRNCAAGLWNHHTAQSPNGELLDEKTAWLLGISATGDGLSLPDVSGSTWSPRANACGAYPEGGYHVMRDGTGDREVLAVFDVGVLGWPQTAVHGHADALSIWLHLGGRPVLIDPGTFNYQDTPLRRQLRGTAVHNTLAFGTADQAEYLNRFVWGKRSQVELLRDELNGLETIFEGRVRWWNRAVHSRVVRFAPRQARMVIEDAWQGPEPPTISFCLAPQVEARLVDSACHCRIGDYQMILRAEAANVTCEPIAVSPKCYQVVQSTRVAVRPGTCSGTARTEIEWRFV